MLTRLIVAACSSALLIACAAAPSQHVNTGSPDRDAAPEWRGPQASAEPFVQVGAGVRRIDWAPRLE